MAAQSDSYIQQIREARDYLRLNLALVPEIIMVLGSGYGSLAELFKEQAQRGGGEVCEIYYSDIPNFPVSGVKGHSGKLLVGELNGRCVGLLQGRVHLYEGYSAAQVAFAVRAFALLGTKNLIVTNAAGGLNPKFSPADYMVIENHISFLAQSPSVGVYHPELGEMFFDMTYPYDTKFIEHAVSCFKKHGVAHQRGVFIQTMGPAYETAAEVKMLQGLGADAVAMSTLQEVIAARQAGLKVLGISCITNLAAGIGDQLLNHQEVLDMAQKGAAKFNPAMMEILETLPLD